MADSHVESQSNLGSGTTLTVTLAQAVQVGDFLIGIFRGTTSMAVSDNINGAWTQLGTVQGNHYCFYFQNSAAASGGSLIITATAGASGTIRIGVDNLRGLVTTGGALGTSQANTNSGTSILSGTIAGIGAGKLIWIGEGDSLAAQTYGIGASNGVANALGCNQTSNGSNVVTGYVLSSASGTQDSSLASATLSAGTSANAFQVAVDVIATAPAGTAPVPVVAATTAN